MAQKPNNDETTTAKKGNVYTLELPTVTTVPDLAAALESLREFQNSIRAELEQPFAGLLSGYQDAQANPYYEGAVAYLPHGAYLVYRAEPVRRLGDSGKVRGIRVYYKTNPPKTDFIDKAVADFRILTGDTGGILTPDETVQYRATVDKLKGIGLAEDVELLARLSGVKKTKITKLEKALAGDPDAVDTPPRPINWGHLQEAATVARCCSSLLEWAAAQDGETPEVAAK